MSKESVTENRKYERTPMSSSVMVKGKDGNDPVWKESTNLLSVSRSGAGFFLSRKREVGQLVALMIPMPRHLRSFDREKELYRVWGIVQHCQDVPSKGCIQIGVAFVGKHAPASYHHDGSRSYRIVGINEFGLWKITEAERPFVTRKFPRFQVALEVTLKTLEDDENPSVEETTITENISLRGAAVLSSLKVSAGECVRFTSALPEFSVLAIIRETNEANDGVKRIHLEFIAADFPIKDLWFPAESGEEPVSELRETAEETEVLVG